ncbi:glycosyltransferase [uncultured Selenomonas sp.]|uniref:glycosyltransferase n=1 Tax=uncultured Selenomonas sp. TaxID=159275 RepID=UPI0025D9D5EE|nr:glycosyltransferase [uncultured Selenomonas sp.]
MPTICDETAMYYRACGDVVLEGSALHFAKHASCSFDTYFNAFSLNKWKAYTGIDRLSLHVRVAGTFELKIYAAEWYRDRIQRSCIYAEAVTSDGGEDIVLPITELSWENISFSLRALTDDAVLCGGGFVTEIDERRLRPVEIDLVMCTFHREAYVTRNIRLLKEQFFGNPAYNGTEHYRIKIVDNGQTLPPSATLGDDRIRLYPNMNVGGSGGYARGMMESLYEGRATHILFMDDDVVVQVEALERTYNLLSLLKEEYQDRFLAGGMLRLDQPNFQHAAGEFVQGHDTFAVKGGTDLDDYKNVVYNEKFEHAHREYSGWWFCCMPCTIARLDNLPYPFFVRYDDIEYSLRNIDRLITLNGISVWHAAFDRKYSALMEVYYVFRNQMVVILLQRLVGRKAFLKFFTRRFARQIFRYDYPAAELLLDGVENVLQGPDFFMHTDTVRDLKEHGAKQIKTRPLSEFTGETINHGAFRASLGNVGERKLTKWLRFLTLNGHFLPDGCFRPQNYAEYGGNANSKQFFRYRRVLACDPNFEEGVLLDIDRGKCFKALWRWGKDFLRIALGWKRLEKQYHDALPDMTSNEFWRKYLKLDE